MSKSDEEYKALWNSLNDSEKHGIQFGLFPARLGNLTHEDIIVLMDIASVVNE